jgi:hypothetical protein
MSTAPADRARGLASRTRGAWRRLTPEQRLATIAALALLASMLLPWYQETGNAIVDGRLAPIEDSKNAFQVYSFVEAAIFLVAAGILVLMFARGERRAFHLPGGDGTVVLAAGLWVMFLVFYRQLDKPDGREEGPINISVGVQWGIFIAFLLGALLAYAGYRIRAAHVPEPDLEAARPPAPPDPPTGPTRPMGPARRKPAGASEAPTTVEGQLSFDEAPDEAPTERAEPAAPRVPREPPEDGDVPEYHPPPRRRHPG